MPRKYRHISDYEKEIIKMYEQGMSLSIIRRSSSVIGLCLFSYTGTLPFLQKCIEF